MDIDHFHRFKKGKGVCQNIAEWQMLFEFLETYFRNRGIDNPVVVELGTERNNQKHYFKEYLGATHIGIDRTDEHGSPDILGDILNPKTTLRLIEMLGGRGINLLMIEPDLDYSTYFRAYNIYDPWVENIICLHSVQTVNTGAWKLWRELKDERDEYIKLEIFNQHPEGHANYIVRMGKGLVIKKWR